jgi:hypothetical protein
VRVSMLRDLGFFMLMPYRLASRFDCGRIYIWLSSF